MDAFQHGLALASLPVRIYDFTVGHGQAVNHETVDPAVLRLTVCFRGFTVAVRICGFTVGHLQAVNQEIVDPAVLRLTVCSTVKPRIPGSYG